MNTVLKEPGANLPYLTTLRESSVLLETDLQLSASLETRVLHGLCSLGDIWTKQGKVSSPTHSQPEPGKSGLLGAGCWEVKSGGRWGVHNVVMISTVMNEPE